MVRFVIATAAITLAVFAGAALAQNDNPIYVDDSPTAEQVLVQLPRLAAQDNLGEATSIIQRLLDEEPDRLVPSIDDPDLYHSVRARLHEALLTTPALLQRYRATQEPLARRLLQGGQVLQVERSYLLTTSGWRAAMLLAEEYYESARFEAAAATLAQLESHPDRAPDSDLAKSSARLLAKITPLTGKVSVRDMTLRFAEGAGLAGEITPESLGFIARPPSASIRSTDMSSPGPGFTPGELLPRPLRSASIADQSAGGLSEASLLRGQRLSAGQPKPWMLPVLAGDYVLVNDTYQISAWDRVTLERVWNFAPLPAKNRGTAEMMVGSFRRANAPKVEDSSAVVVSGQVAVGIMRSPADRGRQVPLVLSAVSMESGQLLWSVVPSELRRDWRDTSFSGPPVVVGDTVVCSLFQFSPLRRVMSSHIIGLDLYSGELRWVRLVGTAGVAPSQRINPIAHLSVNDQGIVYRSDPLGVLTAIEAHSGRPVWVRRLKSETSFGGSSRALWEQPSPIIFQDRVVVLAPDQLSVLVLDKATGQVVGRRDASVLGWPDYLLRCKDSLVSVGSQIVVTDMADMLSADPKIVTGLDGLRAPGRVRIAGDDLLIPSTTGVILVDPNDSGVPARIIELDYPGSPIAMGDQLIVTDGEFVHAYLPWLTAERALSQRLEESPDDPSIALTYAELAYRAGKLDRVPIAADAALAAATRLGQSDRARAARTRLYESLSAMLSADLAHGGSFVAVQDMPPQLRKQLVDRLGLAATTPEQRVGHLMQTGRLAQIQSEWADAATAYQEILLDDELSSAQHTQGRHRQRAELAASAAVRDLVALHPRAYREFDSAANDQLEAIDGSDLVADADADEYERLARRYPVARVAPLAYLKASDLHVAAGRFDRSIQSLQGGIDTLYALADQRAPSSDITGEVAGRLVRSLAEADRLFAASQTLERIIAALPGIKLTYFGEQMQSQELADKLAADLVSLARLPRIGQAPVRMSQAVAGWSIVRPISAKGRVPRNHLLMYSREMGQLALFGINSESTGNLGFDPLLVTQESPGKLKPIWSRSALPGTNPSLVRLEPSSAILLWGVGDQASIEFIDTVTGSTRWQTPMFGDLFEGEPDRRRTGLVETPLDGPSRLSDILVVIGEDYIAIVERTGRAAIFDAVTGETVWTAMFDVPVVYEASIGAGVFVLGGERPADLRAGEAAGIIPMIASYDITTRTTLDINDTSVSLFRWVRVDRAGKVLVGLDGGVICSDPRRREQLWAIDDPAVRLSGDAWLVSGRAVILGLDGQLWQIDMDSGKLRDAPLEDLSRVRGSSNIRLNEGAQGELVFSTDRGMIVFDRHGTLIGGDAAAGASRVLPPVLAEGVSVMLQSDGMQHFESGSVYRMSLLDSRTGQLRGHADLRLLHDPDSVVLLDDHIIISAGNATFVYDTPVEADNE